MSVLRIVFFSLAAPLILLIVLIYAATDIKATVNSRVSPTRQDIKRARTIIDEQLSRRGHAAKTLNLNEKDLNIVSNHLLNRYIQSVSEIELFKNEMAFNTSLSLPNNLFNPYLNIQFKLSQQGNRSVISHLNVGQIKIPDEYAGWLLMQIIKHSQLNHYYVLARQNIKNITVSPNNLELNYSWPTENNKQARQLITDQANNSPITFYQKQLAEIVRKHDRKWLLSLADLLQPMFKTAHRRSQHLDPIEENRAIIFVVNTYVNKKNIAALIPTLSTAPVIEPLKVYIYKRRDLAQHFMASATLTAFGSAQLSHLLGQEKELLDADKGSGFSFIDLAADRAGVRFGETATQSKQMATALQKNMAAIQNYQAFMPAIKQLPENLTRQQFTERFKSFDSKTYQDQLKVIDSRIAACVIYQNL